MDQFSLVIFGVTGNLAQLKVLPALYDLIDHGLLPPETNIIGVARRTLSHEQFLDHVASVLHQKNQQRQTSLNNDVWKKMSTMLSYVSGDANDPATYQALKQKLKQVGHPNRFFYLATFPSLYQTILQQLADHELDQANGWARLLVEKPIGTDLQSAQQINQTLQRQ